MNNKDPKRYLCAGILHSSSSTLHLISRAGNNLPASCFETQGNETGWLLQKWQMKTKDLQSTVNLLKLGQIHEMLKKNRKENVPQRLVYSYSLHFCLSFMDTYGIVTLLSLCLDSLCIISYCFKTVVRKWGKICC